MVELTGCEFVLISFIILYSESALSGNLIVIAGAALAITGLTFGGIRFPWGSAQVLAPLLIGLALLAFFLFYERKFAKEPSIPWEVVRQRTSFSG